MKITIINIGQEKQKPLFLKYCAKKGNSKKGTDTSEYVFYETGMDYLLKTLSEKIVDANDIAYLNLSDITITNDINSKSNRKQKNSIIEKIKKLDKAIKEIQLNENIEKRDKQDRKKKLKQKIIDYVANLRTVRFETYLDILRSISGEGYNDNTDIALLTFSILYKAKPGIFKTCFKTNGVDWLQEDKDGEVEIFGKRYNKIAQ